MAQPIAIINETLARLEFPGENPIGKHITFWNTSREIVGVVGARISEVRLNARLIAHTALVASPDTNQTVRVVVLTSFEKKLSTE